MRFESGMLGFLVVVLAIGFSIAGTILLSAEEQTYTVTKYDLVTDVTGLFDTDESPQYFDYDLSQNYTGYYTMNTVVNGVNYWGGADYNPTSINNYPVQYAPEDDTTTSVDLSTLGLTNIDPPGDRTFTVLYYSEAPPTTSGIYRARANCVSLADVISALNLNDKDVVMISPGDTGVNNWIFFGSISDIDSIGGGYSYAAYYVKNEYSSESSMNPVAISMKYTKISNKVELYYGETPSNDTLVRTLTLENTMLMFSNGYTDSNITIDGQTASVTVHETGERKYMDISRGVTITGVTP